MNPVKIKTFLKTGFLLIGLFVSAIAVAGGIQWLRFRNGSPVGTGVYALPTWSPDGRFLAFLFRKPGQDHDLWIFDTESSVFKQFQDKVRVSSTDGLAWQSNTTLGFIRDFKNQLYLFDTEEFQTQFVADLGQPELAGFSFNPIHPEEVTFAGEEYKIEGRLADLYTFNLETLEVKPLTQTPDIIEESPLWSHNGENLAFRNDKGLVIRKLDGSESLIPDIYVNFGQYTWSPDDSRILFRGTYREPGLYLLDLETKQTKLVLDEAVAYVSWSPDGKSVAYVTVGVPGRNELYIRPAEELGLSTRTNH